MEALDPGALRQRNLGCDPGSCQDFHYFLPEPHPIVRKQKNHGTQHNKNFKSKVNEAPAVGGSHLFAIWLKKSYPQALRKSFLSRENIWSNWGSVGTPWPSHGQYWNEDWRRPRRNRQAPPHPCNVASQSACRGWMGSLGRGSNA